MVYKGGETAAIQKIEHLLGLLRPALPISNIALRVSACIAKQGTGGGKVVRLIECDPILAMQLLIWAKDNGIDPEEEQYSIQRIVNKMPSDLLCEKLALIDVFKESGQAAELLQEELIQHSVAVACCAKIVAEMLFSDVEADAAYLAGLLHDIAKIMLGQSMPKSFGRIIEESKARKVVSCEVEKEFLGVDHAVLGRRITQKWGLPEQIQLAIWLHHCQTREIQESIGNSEIAHVVRAADMIVRHVGIGDSGSYDEINREDILEVLSISAEELEEIERDLAKEVSQRSGEVGLGESGEETDYCEILRGGLGRLLSEKTTLNKEAAELRKTSTFFGMLTEFLGSLTENSSEIEAAKNLAFAWQKCFAAGKVACIKLNSGLKELSAAIIQSDGESQVATLHVPDGSRDLSEVFDKDSVILEVCEESKWLIDQLGFSMDSSRIALLMGRRKVSGAVVFELNYPADFEKSRQYIQTVTSISANVLDICGDRNKQQYTAELLAEAVGSVQEQSPVVEQLATEKPVPQASQSEEAFAALTEMAAGAAHELNNPLSVVSGRVQLLKDSEEDEGKKKILSLIESNAGEISDIISCLLAFANPEEPKTTKTSISQILDEAVQLTMMKKNLDNLNVQIEIPLDFCEIVADSGQIVSALSNILCNSIESYMPDSGPVKVTAEKEDGFVTISIGDCGCGMDEETARKAVYPFFSGKAAGRGRGMGLSFANRLIKLNGGRLKIESEPDKGTTVSVNLPLE